MSETGHIASPESTVHCLNTYLTRAIGKLGDAVKHRNDAVRGQAGREYHQARTNWAQHWHGDSRLVGSEMRVGELRMSWDGFCQGMGKQSGQQSKILGSRPPVFLGKRRLGRDGCPCSLAGLRSRTGSRIASMGKKRERKKSRLRPLFFLLAWAVTLAIVFLLQWLRV